MEPPLNSPLNLLEERPRVARVFFFFSLSQFCFYDHISLSVSLPLELARVIKVKVLTVNAFSCYSWQFRLNYKQ